MGRVKKNRGFTLIEAAVAIGVVAILAGMMAPLGVRILDRQREEATRRSLQMACEAMFGSKERRVPNLKADMGFAVFPVRPSLATRMVGPDGVEYRVLSLEDLIRRPPEHLPFAMHVNFPHMHGLGPGEPPQAFAWGWHGPYWNGSAGRPPVIRDYMLPLDAWGHPISLVLYPGNNFQFRSGGRKGNIMGDTQIGYPSVPADLSTYSCTVIVHVLKRNQTTILRGRYFIRYAGINRVTLNPNTGPTTILGDEPGNSSTQFIYALPPGPKDLCVLPTDAEGIRIGNFARAAIPFDVMPGETREIWCYVD